MTKIYLVIPIIVGVLSGAFLAFYHQSEDESLYFTKSNMMEGGSPILGDSSALITILEWGDYQCTFCYKFHDTTLKVIQKDYVKTGKVNVVFKDFPLNGADSVLASEASYCARDQGKYWEFHDELYKNWAGERTGWITRDSLNLFATTVDLDLEKFNDCIDSNVYTKKVNDLYNLGREMGIDATPSFLIFNDEKVIKIRGNQPLEVFLKTLDEF